MELKEIHAKQVTVEVRDEATGEVFRRTLPMEYYETANFLRLSGEDRKGKPSELVFVGYRNAASQRSDRKRSGQRSLWYSSIIF